MYFMNNGANVWTIVVDCKWGPWSDQECSATCGTSAMKTLTRKIELKAAFGGRRCIGDSTKIANCGLKPCPGTEPYLNLSCGLRINIIYVCCSYTENVPLLSNTFF